MNSSIIKFGVVVFPGSNCDHDCFYVLRKILKQDVRFLWHKSSSLEDVDVVILPGGFSYGDYLRCGAIACFSPIMKIVIDFAKKGGKVLGICNGFQILCESGLLPGALLRNRSLKFICDNVNIRVENNTTIYTSAYKQNEVLKIPIAHGDGNYFADVDTIKMLEDSGQVVFRYCEPDGNVTLNANPNGSVNNIAGIINRSRNIMGMMPHPERASDEVLRNIDGRKLFESIINERLL